MNVTLSEHASDIDYFVPYPALDEAISTHITYLDTVGRPKITLKYAQLTDKHGGNIYVCRLYVIGCRIELQLTRHIGHLQGAVLGSSAETFGGRDCIHGRLCTGFGMEACRYPYPEEVICMC